MAGYLLVAVAVYIGIVAVLYFGQRKLVYLPDDLLPDPARYGVSDMRPAQIRTEDGLDLVSWFSPPREGYPTVVLFHGNAGHLGIRGFKARPLIDQGYGVLLVGYRGYNGNPGTPSETGLYADARANIVWLSGHAVPTQDIVLYGESLGSGVAVQMAYEGNGRGLVLESPFSSLADVGAAHYWWLPVRFLIKDRFDSLSKISAVSVPVLIVHGSQDWIVPVRFGKKLFAAARDPKQLEIVEGAGHNDLFDHGALGRILPFLFEVSSRKPDRSGQPTLR
ncbi:MAG: alpha/beta hydrolase [Rhodospirillales bacterium]|nr:alpha/beta hydrolase [Rhodospirillales bacterium]